MYDVIVVGGRCAGASTALLLARRGCKVLLLDRAQFPSDIPHGHLIHRHGPRRLKAWGLLDRIVATGCPPVTSMSTHLGDFELLGEDLVVDGVALGYGPRRAVLDRVLVEAAVEAGAEFRDAFVVEDVVLDGDRVVGVRGRDTHTRAPATELAAFVVGADGRNSRVARLVQAPMYDDHPALTSWYFSYWSGVPSAGLEVLLRERRLVFAFPTHDNLLALFVAWPAHEAPSPHDDVEAVVMAVVDSFPSLAERVRSGRREERFYGATHLPNFFRRPFGPGWALVGDAGCHKDPYLALGCCDAFRDAELLVDALHQGLAGARGFGAALADFERRRNEATRPDYQENLLMARLQPPAPPLAQLRAGVRGHREDTRRFYLAREGMIPRETFFNPENLQRLAAAASLQAAPCEPPAAEAR